MRQPSTSKEPDPTRGRESEPLVVLGEVHTGLITHHSALRRAETERLLAWLVPAGQVLSWERPIPHAVSAPVLTGLDCSLALGIGGGKSVRAVGTASSRVALTGGTILQCSTVATVRAAQFGRREGWAHYTSRPGELETLSPQQADHLAEGFLGEGGQRDGVADFGAVCERLARRVQNAPMLEGRSPLLFQWTRTRWAATSAGTVPEGAADGANAAAETAEAFMRVGEGTDRTLRIQAVRAAVEDLAEFCGDVALHDWILTTVLGYLDEISGAEPERQLAEIDLILTRLRHLWMPSARVSTELSVLWSEFERKPGFSRQWQSLVARMSDQIALHTAHQLGVLINHHEQCT
ncbi:hypothetical protein KDL01_21820 [Actinospica durhamensis]|uniref:Uncharacterized protein n=1 Tax=Actinospica durhamensis TaxID=1508375 RepID=A0A941ERP9_9ACTN|nr:SCO2521 family protein [Actinospica durhamensis]MBR7835928.1 hypothetical protein [Actinospica durhamensis]